MVLTIGKSEVECESFRVRGAYSSTIARLFALPVAVESKEPLTLEVTIKGNKFKPYRAGRRVYWNRKHVGFFVLSNVAQEWDGNRYKTRLELKQCERSDVPDEPVPVYKWRHDLRALADNLPQTEGAKIEAGRIVNPFADSWKLGTATVADAGDAANSSPAVLPISQGGTGAFDPAIAIINLGGISSASKGIPFGVAPLGADGKISPIYLPPGSGGGGSSVVFPITIAQGGTGALDAATARTNLGAITLADLPPYPTLASLGAVANSVFIDAVNALIPAMAIGAANGVAPLGSDSLIPSSFLPPYPTLASLEAVANSTYIAGLALKLDASQRNAPSGVAGLDGDGLVAIGQIPLNNLFAFTAGARFSGGSIPPVTTSITQAGVDANGNPRYWLVNAAASAGNRLKSITIANNGNIQFRHHADDGTEGNVLEHTASGNVLTNGTLRCGSGATHFTGATFVPGALYFRSDINMLIYSDGTSWRRIDTNAVV